MVIELVVWPVEWTLMQLLKNLMKAERMPLDKLYQKKNTRMAT